MGIFRLFQHVLGGFTRRVAAAPARPDPAAWRDDQFTAAWLGHATVLINFFGVRILTDPTFFSRVGLRFGPLTLGPKRYVACALAPRQLPPIDLILLSHAHMDHLDLRSLSRLDRETLVVTASRTADIVARLRFRHVHELDWNEAREFSTPRGPVTIAAFRLRHWGARMQRDTQRRYNAYILERAGRRICFAGDTAHTDASVLGSRGAIDLIIVPIAAYHPWIHAHCTPEEAIAMADQAGARFVMPIHHQTFKLSWEPMDEPITRFRAALTADRIALTRIGETFVLSR